jgi:NAD(P)H-hydrate epimerase
MRKIIGEVDRLTCAILLDRSCFSQQFSLIDVQYPGESGGPRMTIRPLSREEVRSIDARAAGEMGLPTLVLMENAGRGAAEWLRGRLGSGGVVVACGPGNNGGDGGVIARHLDAWEVPVRVVWFAVPDRLSGDAAVQRGILVRWGVAQETWEGPVEPTRLDELFRGADWIVDGLLGTGLTRPVEGPLRAVIEAINRAGRPTLALDLSSGLDADSGQPQGVAVRATATVTFVAPKLGFDRPGAAGYTGAVHVIEIGAPRRVLEPFRRV